MCPVVFEQIPLDQDSLRIFQFEEILDDLERAGPVPAADRLRVETHGVALGEVRVDDRAMGSVERDAAETVVTSVAVDQQAVENEVMRDPLASTLIGPSAAQMHQGPGILDVRSHGDLKSHEPPVAGARHGAERPVAAGIDNPRHGGSVLRAHAIPLGRQVLHPRRADCRPATLRRARGQNEVACEGGSGLQYNLIARRSTIQDGLQVPTGGHVNRLATDRCDSQARVDQHARTLRRGRLRLSEQNDREDTNADTTASATRSGEKWEQ